LGEYNRGNIDDLNFNYSASSAGWEQIFITESVFFKKDETMIKIVDTRSPIFEYVHD